MRIDHLARSGALWSTPVRRCRECGLINEARLYRGFKYGLARWREKAGFLRSHTFEYVMEWRFDLSGGGWLGRRKD
ncbi:hypothetical protein A9K81_25120 [Pseudomonas syringae pv. syringae]|nr:hypothetical protein A9K81_25120 [Pseudomonas syringae pv. syringae]